MNARTKKPAQKFMLLVAADRVLFDAGEHLRKLGFPEFEKILLHHRNLLTGRRAKLQSTAYASLSRGQKVHEETVLGA
jgi:hypothetical protein